jgi:hypothetical protein
MDKDNTDADEIHPDQLGERTESDPTLEQWSIIKKLIHNSGRF